MIKVGGISKEVEGHLFEYGFTTKGGWAWIWVV